MKKEDHIINDNSTNRQIDENVEVMFNKLPILLQKVCEPFEDKDKLLVLMSSLTVVSSILPNVFGRYMQHRVHPNLLLYVIGKAGSGKGNMTWTKSLIANIERKQNSEYPNSLLKELMEMGLSQNALPASERLLIPANSSTSAFIERLDAQNGRGLVFETEGDTLANIFKTDYGDWSSVLRKVFHHEAVSLYRKTDKIDINIEEPKLSVLISSTPKQLMRIISDAENGLFSRFAFVFTEPVEEFTNVFSSDRGNKQEIFENVSKSLLLLYSKLGVNKSVEVVLSDQQQTEFVGYFNKAKSQLTNLFSEDLDASVNRMGLIVFRICMILSVLRNADSAIDGVLTCSDDDFKTAMKLGEILLVNANKAIQILPKQNTDGMSDKKLNLFQSLPNEFSTAEAKEKGEVCGLSGRTIDRFLTTKCFENVSHGYWRKSS